MRLSLEQPCFDRAAELILKEYVEVEEDQVEASGSQEQEQEEVPQEVDDDQGVGVLLAGKVALQQWELEVPLLASPLVLFPELLWIIARLLDLPHVLHQAHGAVVGLVQLIDDEEEVRVKGRGGCITPQQVGQVHEHCHHQQRVREDLESPKGLGDSTSLSIKAMVEE